MNKFLYTIVLLFAFMLNLEAQQVVTGFVKDSHGNFMPGVRISQLGNESNYVITDEGGVFSLPIEKNNFLEVELPNVLYKRVLVTNDEMSITLDSQMDKIINMTYQKRTEANQTQSASIISCDDLLKSATSTSQLMNALYGLLPGLNASQNAGWDARASLNVRGIGAPLIIVDGFQRALTDLTIEEIESIQILKDGAATAMWGVRGAAGVLVVTTKRGLYNSFDVDINYRHGFDFPINQPKMLDSYGYASAWNEALQNDGLPTKYTNTDLENLKNGNNSELLPNTDWANIGMRNFSESNQFNILLRGGAKRVRYMALLDYKNHFGLLNEDYTHFSSNFNSQIRNYSLALHMNLDVDITASTKFQFNTHGVLFEQKEPVQGINNVFKGFYTVPSIAYPVRTINNNWGGNSIFKQNPIAEFADKGFTQSNRRMLYTDIRLTQDLSMFVKGLSAELAFDYDNSAVFREEGKKNYRYEELYLNPAGDLTSNLQGENTKLQIGHASLDTQFMRFNWEARVNYNRNFRKHHLNAALLFAQNSSETLDVTEAMRRQNVMLLAGYNYLDRYMIDFVGNCQGTSVLLDADKYRFYPAVSIGWNLSNEKFMKDFSNLDLLKIRASYGKSAYDNINYGLGDYFFGGGGAYYFGTGNVKVSGLKERSLPIAALNLETSNKYNVGVDLRLWKSFNLSAEYFYDKHTDILVKDNVTTSIIGITLPMSGIGETEYRGFELNLGWNQTVRDFNYYANANFSWYGSKVIENGEGYVPYDYLSHKGSKVGQLFGLEAIGYFQDDNDIANSPVQKFSDVRPGDIKYKDQNGDNVIDNNDKVAIGKSTSIPETVLGLNLGFEYKGFGVDMTFNGAFGLSKVLNVNSLHQPLRKGTSNISTWYMEDNVRWTPETKDIATLPRLSTLSNDNNYQTSTQWLENGSFFKLRNLAVHYNFPQKWVEKIKMDKLQLYVKAQNVFSIDNIKYANCEDLTLGYPDLFSFCVGLNINF